MAEETIKVAVRVRPFNQREKDRKAKLIIRMEGNSTFLTDPRLTLDESKQFNFDHSYWSHDGFIELPSGLLRASDVPSSFVSQQKIFDDLGRDLLKNAFDGFNCTLFAYGQTGSGKSYSMIGYGVNRGLIPHICDQLFRNIETKKNFNIRFEVTLSMMEIYNEQVLDLLSKECLRGALTVRQHPTSGHFYAHGLQYIPVGNYHDIERLMAIGTANRSIAATSLNTTSSRAHTIVTLHLTQMIKTSQHEMKKSSVINLVDLAGSERFSHVEVSRDRFKEGTNINRSLSTLGNVISALVDIASGSKKKLVVPYRESVLTKLLQNSLGGNSKTVMIATVSPADINYDVTLSTLRFADRVKRIKNHAIINENSIDKLIRQLKEENQCLKRLIETESYNLQLESKSGMNWQDLEQRKKQMEEEILSLIETNQQILQDSKISWESKLKTAQLNDVNPIKSILINESFPYLANLNEDSLLSYIILHYLNQEETTIGSRDCTITLHGLSILERHAIIRSIDTQTYQLIPGEANTKIKVNGYNLNGTISLQHKDRLVFGANHFYVFLNPNHQHDTSSDIPSIITWEFAQKEIAQVKGYSLGNLLTIEQEQLQQKILNILPLLSEANAISEELNKYRVFEIVLMPITFYDGVFVKGSKLMVRMKNLINHNTWYWTDEKFIHRSFIIKDHYQRYLRGEEEILYIPKEDDPFWEPVEDLLIGTASVFPQCLAYRLDFDDEICIMDYKGFEQGRLTVTLNPCLANGTILTEDHSVDQPDQLLHKPYYFKITLCHIEINDACYTKGFRIRYKIFNELEFTKTAIVGRDANFARMKQARIVVIPNIDFNWLGFFENNCIIFQIFAVQEESKSSAAAFQRTTRELKIMEKKQDESKLINVNHQSGSTSTDAKLKAEFTLLQRKFIRLEQKEKRLQSLCRDWEHHHEYGKFYQSICAIAFSTGTKLRPSQITKKVINPIDIYLFGQEEQDYLNGIDQGDTDKQKYWDDYYERISSEENHGLISYRMNRKRAKSIKITRHSTTELTSICQRSTSNDDTANRRKGWRDLIQSKRYHRINGSTICTVQ